MRRRRRRLAGRYQWSPSAGTSRPQRNRQFLFRMTLGSLRLERGAERRGADGSRWSGTRATRATEFYGPCGCRTPWYKFCWGAWCVAISAFVTCALRMKGRGQCAVSPARWLVSSRICCLRQQPPHPPATPAGHTPSASPATCTGTSSAGTAAPQRRADLTGALASTRAPAGTRIRLSTKLEI